MGDPRAALREILAAAVRTGAPAGLAEGVLWEVSAPLPALHGPEAVAEGFLAPLRAALSGLHRRDEILIGGMNRRAQGGYWCAAITHYAGNFTGPLWGIAPSGHLAFLRAGEFYRIEDGRIAQARIILDLPDLMRQAGRMPFPFSYGLETLFPGPATHDGVCPATGDGEASLTLVERMLGALGPFDPKTFASDQQTGASGTWAEDMLWYGPAGIGSNFRWEGFVQDHRAPFLRAFPDRKGGNHYARIGDGNYAAVSGWPSMTMTFQGDYLGVPADGRPLTLRVMDFYRCAGGRIAENWVFLDYVDLFAQMGVDLIARGGGGAG
jgi:predicted ester cyclase